MKPVLTLVLVLLIPLLVPSTAYAVEYREHTLGAEGLLLFPSFSSGDATTFANTAVGGRAFYGYGLTYNTTALVRFASWFHSGTAESFRSTATDGSTFDGEMTFQGGEGYRAEVGLRHMLLGGFDFAPYLDFCVGYQWTTYRDVSIRYGYGDASGPEARGRDIAIEDFAEGSLTLGGGLSFDYRLANTVLLGLSAAWTHAFAGSYGRDIALSATASYIWF